MPAALTLPLLLALLPGCQARRRLVVTSDPPGAEIRIDGQQVGETPARIPFIHYGVRRVTLYKDGFLTNSRVIELKPPWFARFPIDFFSELVLPLGWSDLHEMHAVLQPGQGVIPAPDLRSVLERAESLRRAGPEGPRPMPPPVVDGNGDGNGTPPDPEPDPAGGGSSGGRPGPAPR